MNKKELIEKLDYLQNKLCTDKLINDVLNGIKLTRQQKDLLEILNKLQNYIFKRKSGKIKEICAEAMDSIKLILINEINISQRQYEKDYKI